MEIKNKWVDISILGLCMVALSGMIMRSKIVFSIPSINYNHLLEAHSHFTFAGWVTLSLMVLMVNELLPPTLSKKRIYQWLLGGIAISAWAMFLTYYMEGYASSSIICSFVFILISFLFCYFFINDVRKAGLAKPALWLAISSLVCLLLSSAGTIIIAYIYFAKSFDAIVYRDALFTYLHFQYNGFFSLAIFSILFNSIYSNLGPIGQRDIARFSLVLCASIIPSLFLSYLWANPSDFLRVVAILGSLILLLCSILFAMLTKSLRNIFFLEKPIVRFLIILSMGSFLLKTFLQCFTIFPIIGNAIFGNRPVIMGFLHLVFLAFTSLFLIAYFSKKGILDETKKICKIALAVFALAILFNEITLISQGLTTMLMPGSNLFPWALWVIGICLFIGAVLIGIARVITKQNAPYKL